jgi:hypothetical protein
MNDEDSINSHDSNFPFSIDDEIEVIEDENEELSTPQSTPGSNFTISWRYLVSLMYLLNEMDAPDFGFELKLDWARQAHNTGFDVNASAKTHSANLK